MQNLGLGTDGVDQDSARHWAMVKVALASAHGEEGSGRRLISL